MAAKSNLRTGNKRSWLIACDESGIHGSTHYGFGSLWLKWQRRGDFIEHFRDIKESNNYDYECKWNKITSKQFLPFYKDLIEYFFKRKWLTFHCLIVRKEMVRKEIYHDNDWDLARRKHFTMLLTTKMRRALQRFPDREHEFRVYVDPIASRYDKADESIEIISNNILNQRFRNTSPVKSVITRDSKDTPSIQLCDLFLGAVMETWQQKSTNRPKQEIRDFIADHLGWEHLDSDTMPSERKFNIWYMHDPIREKRRVVTRNKVNLKYPYPHGNIS